MASHSPHFQLQWPEKWSTVDIAPKEMAPVVIAAALWGRHWTNSQVLFRCDNFAVVEVINNRSAKDPCLSLTWRGVCFSLQPPTDSHFQPSMSQGLRMGWRMHSLGIVMTYLFLNPHRFYLRPHSSPSPMLLAVQQTNRMDISMLEEAVRRYYAAGLSGNTFVPICPERNDLSASASNMDSR